MHPYNAYTEDHIYLQVNTEVTTICGSVSRKFFIRLIHLSEVFIYIDSGSVGIDQSAIVSGCHGPR